MRTEFLCISVLRVASGPKVKLAGCNSALALRPSPSARLVHSTDRSKVVILVLFVLFVVRF